MAGDDEVVGIVHRHGLKQAPFEVLHADLTRPDELVCILDDVRPDAVINCAAMSIVDTCEAQPELASLMNSEFPGRLAEETARRDIRLVHISTDSIFDGQQNNYTEEDHPSPVNHYGITKLAGERTVRSANPDALVARVNFYGWSLRGQRSLAEWFFYNLSAGRPINGFTDVYFCPLQVNDLVDVLVQAIKQQLSGLYHVVSGECLSKYEFGCRIARQFGLDEALIHPVSWLDGGLRAARAAKLQLCNQKLTDALGVPLPDQAHGLQRFHRLHLEGYREKLLSMGAAG
jgi:dTDP-4-dehydrorhamnose reductase